MFYAIGQHDAIGFCPFSIESTNDPATEPLAGSYDLLEQLTPLILENQGLSTMAGVVLDKDTPRREVHLGEYTLEVAHDYTWGWSGGQGAERWPQAGGILLSTGPDEYVAAGNGIIVTFRPDSPGDSIAGIGNIQEGRYEGGQWVGGRWMNGDQSHQGRHLRIPTGSFGLQRVRLYRYR